MASWSIRVDWELAPVDLTEDELKDVSERIGFAVSTLALADPGTEEWSIEENPREAVIVVAKRDAEDYLDNDTPTRFVVWSQAPGFYGEGSVSPIVRSETGNLSVYL